MTETKKIKRIWVERGIGKKIARALQCSTVIVSLALNGKKDTPLAKKIRYVALKEYRGKEIG